MSGGGGHTGHKPNPDPLVKTGLELSEHTWAEIDFARGTQTRADWIREAIKTALYYDANEKAKLAS